MNEEQISDAINSESSNSSEEHLCPDSIIQISAQSSLLDRAQIKSAIESMLFINERPIEAKELACILDIPKTNVEAAVDELSAEYEHRGAGLCVVKVAGGYQMCSHPNNEAWLKKMYHERNRSKLSCPALETLAILAYKQPLTKMEIESIRGVNVDGVLRTLTNLDLIKIEGRKEVIGRPFLYITTRKFLEYFGLNSLKDLPRLEDFITLAEKEKLTDKEGEKQNENEDEHKKEESIEKISDALEP